MVKTLKRALTGVLAGVIAGPMIVGVLGFVLLSAIWLVQGLFQGWPSEELTGAVVQAAAFGILIAPFGASAGAIIGLVMGGFGRFFGSYINAGSFAGFLGAVIGLLVALSLFNVGDTSPLIVSVIAMSATTIAIAIGVKRLLEWLRAETSLQV